MLIDEQKLKTSLAATKMLYKHKNSRGKITLVRVEGGKVTLSSRETPFSLSNPADCLAVVKKLLEFNITILQSYDNKAFGYQDYTDEDNVVFVWQFDTYEEAVAAAALAVSDERHKD